MPDLKKKFLRSDIITLCIKKFPKINFIWTLLLLGGIIGALQFLKEDDIAANTMQHSTKQADFSIWHAAESKDWGRKILNGINLEWEYFMVHDTQRKFTGSLGFVLADPKGIFNGKFGMPRLLPSGGSMAVAGLFQDGKSFANYDHYDFESLSLNNTLKAAKAEVLNSSKFSEISFSEPTQIGFNKAHLVGESDAVRWNLKIQPTWNWIREDRSQSETLSEPFSKLRGDDVGVLSGENWEVDMAWPRTQISGQIVRKDTGEELQIEGHGYRENSWGQWALVTDGWDFAIVSDSASNVMFAWQTYHNSKTLDYLDLAVMHHDRPEKFRFFARDKELGWKHDDWEFNEEGNQCAPTKTTVVAKNDIVKVTANIDLKNRYIPMVSKATSITDLFVIFVQFPMITGTVEWAKTGEITTFSGQGGGEFGVRRSLFKETALTQDCQESKSLFFQESP